MMWIHPILQLVATVFGAYALYMGSRRFCFQHLSIKCMFNWKKHVKFGKYALALWLVGLVIGVYMAWSAWGGVSLTGGHYIVGVLMIPLIVVGLLTGIALEKPKGKRARLALFHGVTNTALFILALYQVYSGVQAIRLFMLD